MPETPAVHRLMGMLSSALFKTHTFLVKRILQSSKALYRLLPMAFSFTKSVSKAVSKASGLIKIPYSASAANIMVTTQMP